jgi:hypothetical protein
MLVGEDHLIHSCIKTYLDGLLSKVGDSNSVGEDMYSFTPETLCNLCVGRDIAWVDIDMHGKKTY